MGDDQITALMQHIDRSLDQRLKPVQDSISGLTRNTERIFRRLDELSEQMVSTEKDCSFLQREIDRNEKALKECQDDCDKKLEAMKAAVASSETTTKSKVEFWVTRSVAAASLTALGYFVKQFLDNLAR